MNKKPRDFTRYFFFLGKKYWGTSAAGALVSLGKGEFVSESDIWNNKALKPGAVIQVWKKKSDLDRIRKEKKPLSWGTSAVFLEYVNKDSVKVLHFPLMRLGNEVSSKYGLERIFLLGNRKIRDTSRASTAKEESQ